MWTNSDWRMPSRKQQEKIVAEIYAEGRSRGTMLDFGILLIDCVRRATPEQKADLRREINTKMAQWERRMN